MLKIIRAVVLHFATTSLNCAVRTPKLSKNGKLRSQIYRGCQCINISLHAMRAKTVFIRTRGECTPHRTDDAFFLRFLRSRKFSLEAAYNLLVNYCDFRESNPQFVHGVGFEILEKAGACDVIGVPPYKDQNGRRILLYKPGKCVNRDNVSGADIINPLSKWRPNEFSIDDGFSASLLVLELAMLEPQSQIVGGICIVDCAGISMEQSCYMTPGLARKLIQLAVTSQPMKLEALHVVNNSWIVETFFNFFSPLMHDRMKERLHFHGSDMESLHKHVDPKSLPEIYGGIQKDYDYMDWVNGFRKNKRIVKELAAQGYAV